MYENDMQNFIIKETDLPRSDDKKLYGKSFAAWIENRMNICLELYQITLHRQGNL